MGGAVNVGAIRLHTELWRAPEFLSGTKSIRNKLLLLQLGYFLSTFRTTSEYSESMQYDFAEIVFLLERVP